MAVAKLWLQPVCADLLGGVQAQHEQPARGEQHGQVEPLGIHGVDL